MTSLQPINALNLDSVQQQTFIKYFNTLPEKPPTTVRIFDRNDYYSIHGVDATTAAKEVFSSVSNIKKMGVEPNKLDYIVLSKGNFEILVKKLLMVRRYRIEIYVADGSVKSGQWELKYKGSPGYLSQLEEVFGEGFGGIIEDSTPSLMAVNFKTDPITKGRLLGVACIQAADYQMSVAEFTDDDLLTELETITVQMAPSECIIPTSKTDDYKALKKVMDRANVTVTKSKKSEFSTEGLIQDLNRLLKFKDNQQQDANSFPETRKTVAMSSLASAIKYLELLTDESNFGRFRLSVLQADCFVHLDTAALTALNVFPAPGEAPSPSRSLFGLLDRCRTAHGKRLLAQWLRQPLRDINLINERLDIVEAFVSCSQVRLQLHDEHLRRIPDLQTLTRRLLRKKANLHDCYKIYQAANRLPALLQCLATLDNSTVHSSLAEPISELNEDLSKYREMIEATVDMDAVDKGDFLVMASFDEQLQELSEKLQELQKAADKELNKAARELSLEAGKTIKLESNPQTGFNFRVSLKEEQSLRGNKRFTIIDAIKSGARFKNDALDYITDEYIQTRAWYEKEQDKVVAEVINIAVGYTECLFCLSHILARLDVLVSFAIVASTAPIPYCRPEVVESLDEFVLIQARHPCLELQEGISFIPNDVVFKRGSASMHVVTGANMGGKSTWLRAAGACAALALAGAWLPAARARVPRMRLVAARVGAADAERAALSTFMLEMVECASILATATPDSLVLIDELGRGTSTYEGCGIAWAIAEELATKSACFCMFATHYHELTRLAAALPGRVANAHVEAHVAHGQLLLLHRVRPGPALRSLGLHVARLAGLPEELLQDAEARQAQLEGNMFSMESVENADETTEGHKIIEEYLTKCKEIEEKCDSDDTMMEKIDLLTADLKSTNNKYVLSLMG